MRAFWVIDEASAQSANARAATALATTQASCRPTLVLAPAVSDKENPL
jgi:hypothetical protein